MKIFSRTQMVFLSIYLLVSIYLSTIPLFNILGYEFSLAMAFVSYLVSGLYFISRSGVTDESSYLKRGLRLSLHSLLFTLLPLAFMTVKGFFITNCNYLSGLGFYILLPMVSAIFGSSMGSISSIFFKTVTKRILVFIAISLVIFLKTPYQLAYGPNVDAYNHIFGYFAGPIYDEIIVIGFPLIIYRAYTLLISALVFFIASFFARGGKEMARNKTFAVAFAFLALAVLLANIFSSYLGFARRNGSITNELSLRHDSWHFSFHYLRPDDLIVPITEEFEFRHFQISKELDIKRDKKISVFIYPDTKTQKRLMGSAGIFIAKPSNRQIHMTINSPFNLPIKHELTHILAGEFGIPVLKISLRIGLLEGLAVAMEKFARDMTLDELAKASFIFGLAPNISAMMTPWGFWSAQYSIAYYVSGSFSRFLLDRYGVQKFKKIYSGKDFKKTYGRSLEELSQEWKALISTVRLSEEKLRSAEAIFKPKGIFERRCAHEVSSLVQRAKNCSTSGRSREATRLMEKGALLSGDDPSISLKLSDLWFESGNCEKASESVDYILKSGENEANGAIPVYVKIGALKIIGDCKAIQGKAKAATDIYKRIRQDIDYPDKYLENETKIRLLALGVNFDLMQDYLKERDPIKKTLMLKKIISAHPEDGVLNMMIGLLHFRKNDFKNSSYSLFRAVSLNEPLRTYRSKLLGISYFYLKNYRGAKNIFSDMKKNYKDEAIRLFADDWLEKIYFYKRI